jgi:hypothetical protein
LDISQCIIWGEEHEREANIGRENEKHEKTEAYLSLGYRALNVELRVLTIPPIIHMTLIHPSVISAPDPRVAPNQISHPDTQRIGKEEV